LFDLAIFRSNNNCLTFSILSIQSFETFASSSVVVAELVCLIFEDLEPLGVSAPDSHVVGSSIVLDVPGLVVVSSSDSQGLLVEVPDLGSSSVFSLDYHISVVDEI
jgi:hypothetical protein